jgi:chemotaxis protein MotB
MAEASPSIWNNLTRILAVALIAAAGFVAYLVWEHARLKGVLEETEIAKQEFAREITRTKEQVAYLTKRLEEDIAKVSRQKDEELDRLKRTHDDMVSSLKQEIEAGEVTITRIADRLSVNIIDKILFPSGEAAVSEEGKRVLARVGKVLVTTRGKTIRIEGHTDNIPIGPALQGRFPTNWELSTARATNVARFLQESTNIEPGAFEAVGLGEYHPVADNRTPKGRSHNRRIEIILYPRVQSLVKDLPKVIKETTPAPKPAASAPVKPPAPVKPAAPIAPAKPTVPTAPAQP